MEYTEPPLTLKEQTEQLLSRGLKTDRDQLILCLKNVSYYRLSAYRYPFRITGGNCFQEKAILDLIWKHYTFDRQLRLFVMDVIERVEVAVRTQLTCHFSHRYGAFGYTDRTNLLKLNKREFQKWLANMKRDVIRSRETFLDRFDKKYGDCHKLPPLWMFCEVMTFGKMLTLFNGVDDELRRIIAYEYSVRDAVLQSWLGALNIVRNICAHHGRLWNRRLGYKPMIPRPNKFPQWHKPVEISNNRPFAILTILEYMRKKVTPTRGRRGRLKDLFARYPEIPMRLMGFPENWEESPIWKQE